MYTVGTVIGFMNIPVDRTRTRLGPSPLLRSVLHSRREGPRRGERQLVAPSLCALKSEDKDPAAFER